MGQQANAFNFREMGKLSSQPQNPRKHYNTIVSWSSKQLGESIGNVVNKVDKKGKQKEVQKLGEKDSLKKKVDKSV